MHAYSGTHDCLSKKIEREFRKWVAIKHPELVGTYKTMVGINGNLLPVVRLGMWVPGLSDALDTSLSDKPADDKHGSGSGLKGGKADALDCPVQMRCLLRKMLQAKLRFFEYAPISTNHRKAIFDLIYKNCERNANPMHCIIACMDVNIPQSGSQIWDWLLWTYNKNSLSKSSMLFGSSCTCSRKIYHGRSMPKK